jgi:hypothetical protein
VCEHRRGDGLDVVGEHVLAPVRERPGLGDAEQRDPGARARAQVKAGVGACRADEVDDVTVDAVLDEDPRRLLDHACDPGRARHRLELVERDAGGLLGEHARLLGGRRVADVDPHREPVELRLGQRIRALVLDRVLRRHDHERAPEHVADAVDRDLVLLHALEQRGLRLRRRAVDLVDEEEVREDRAGAELELVRPLVEHVDAGHVRGQ